MIDCAECAVLSRQLEEERTEKERMATLARDANYQSTKHCDRAERNYEQSEQERNRTARLRVFADAMNTLFVYGATGYTSQIEDVYRVWERYRDDLESLRRA